MTDEADDKFITLEEASASLCEQGLSGQTVPVLRSAIAARRLEAIKDGRHWRTNKTWLDTYVASLRVSPTPPPKRPTLQELRAIGRRNRPVTIELPPDWRPPTKKR